MSNTVFILGAGASRKAGTPLMGDFLDVAQRLVRTGAVNHAKESFDRVFEAIGHLQSVHSKSELDIHNVESVFAAFEMARLLGKFPGPGIDLDDLIESFKTLVANTIEDSLQFPVAGDQVKPPAPYSQFIELVSDWPPGRMGEARQSVSLITFNYDLALDYALHFDGSRVNYWLSDEEKQGVSLLKLHGSLNWGRCAQCEAVIPFRMDDFFQHHEYRHLGLQGTQWVKLRISCSLGDLEHCGGKIEPRPVIVPPTWNKGEYHQALTRVWSRAARELGEAENIFVAGYSLPESDHFFRFLYSLGSQGPIVLKRFWVFDPDDSVGDRFKRLLGPGARARFRFFKATFEEAIGLIRDGFG